MAIKFDITNRWNGEGEVRAMVTADRLREVLHYSLDTGVFTYRIRVAQRAKAGDVAGSVNSEGYRHINVDGRAYKAHRLAILYVSGSWPPEMVDHINGVRSDNRLSNLRLASRSDNLGNSRVLRRGKSVPKGVTKRGNKWVARIQRHGVQHFLGYFDTIEAAASAYAGAASKTFDQFARSV